MAPGTYEFSERDPLVVRKGTDETDGEFVRFEFTMYPTRNGTPVENALSHEPWGVDNDFEHLHTHQEERWEILSGKVRFVIEGGERTLGPGEDITIPEATPHRHWNPTDQPVRAIAERRPALRTEEWFESVYTLAQMGKTDETGTPNLLYLAVIFDEYPRETYPAAPPVRLQRAIASVLAPVGRLFGLEATHYREKF